MRNHIPNRYTLFFQKVDTHGFNPNVCWEFLGADKGNGYGNIRVGLNNIPAHRYAYLILVDRILDDSLDVCHSCDNRICVNPDHLFLGTRTENMQDAVKKGRTSGGGNMHLREQQVREVVEMLNSGMSPRLVANSTGVSYGSVTAIKAGRSYRGFIKDVLKMEIQND